MVEVILGRTAIRVSQAGFGGYRIRTGVSEHARALHHALASGITLIDTSANYADGGSEELIGQVLGHLVEAGELRREAVTVVSKAGYLQGQNHALSLARRRAGRPFPEIVPYAKGLEHCIHPEFLADQLTRSLARLRLETLDLYLLHNPEYYLGWAAQAGIDPDAAKNEYYRRIENAFRHLEIEADAGRIRWYGVSSNSFPADASDPQFTCLERIWEIAESISAVNRFAVVQLPMNLFEAGAVLTANQPCGATAIQFAHRKNIGVLVNRPLNAFTGNRLIRLAEVNDADRLPTGEIEQRIAALGGSERDFLRRVLPELGLDAALSTRVTSQFLCADALRRAWDTLSGYDHWLQVRNEHILPRVRKILEFLEARLPASPEAVGWKDGHLAALDAALRGVGGYYAESAVKQVAAIRSALASADTEWSGDGPLSRLSLRALRSTEGVSCVLVGMRRPAYVDDVLAELDCPIKLRERRESWQNLSRLLRPE
jgi:hypothetical protein